MTRWIRLSAHILIPIVYIFILETGLSPLPRLPEKQKFSVGQFIQNWVGIPTAYANVLNLPADCAQEIKTFGEKVERARKAIEKYNSMKSKTREALQGTQGVIGDVRTETSSSLTAEGKASLVDIAQAYTSVFEDITTKLSSSNVTNLAPVHVSTAVLEAKLSSACEVEKNAKKKFTAKVKDNVLAFFAKSTFFGGDYEWGFKHKVSQLFTTCSESIDYIGNENNPQLKFKSNCEGEKQAEYNQLLDIRLHVGEKKAEADIPEICKYWRTPSVSHSKKPEEVLPMPQSDSVGSSSTPDVMKKLVKKCTSVNFDPWFTAENFKTALVDNTAAIDVTVSAGVLASSLDKLIEQYAIAVGKAAGVGSESWFDKDKSGVFNIPADGYLDSFSGGSVKTKFDIGPEFLKKSNTFVLALHYLSLRKCLDDDNNSTPECVKKAQEKQYLPYPFNGNPHPHSMNSQPTIINTTIRNAFICLARENGDQAAYDLGQKEFNGKYGGCITNPETFRARTLNDAPNAGLNTSKVGHLFAIGKGVLRTASGLIALNEIQKLHPDKHIFRLSLTQPKFNPSGELSAKWQEFMSDLSKGLNDINFQKVINFFGAEMLFMQKEDEMVTIKPIEGIDPKATQSVEDLLKKIFSGNFGNDNSEVGKYVNTVRANWVNELVNPLYRAYQSQGEKTWGQTLTLGFKDPSSLSKKHPKIWENAAFKLLLGNSGDPSSQPYVVNYETGEVVGFLDAFFGLKDAQTQPFIYLPAFMVGDYYKKIASPATGLFPMARPAEGGTKFFGLTKTDAFIGKDDKRLKVIAGADVIAALQTFNLSLAQLIHRECILKDSEFIALMGQAKTCMNDPSKRQAAVATVAGTPGADGIAVTSAQACIDNPRPADVIQGDKIDMCKAFAVVQTHFDQQLKDQSAGACGSGGTFRWIPFSECWSSTKLGVAWTGFVTLIILAVLVQLVFMAVFNEKAWFWEWDEWKKPRWKKKKKKDSKIKPDPAQPTITEKTNKSRSASEEAAKAALPAYRSKTKKGPTRVSSGNVRTSNAPANTGKSRGAQRRGSLPPPTGLDFKFGATPAPTGGK